MGNNCSFLSLSLLTSMTRQFRSSHTPSVFAFLWAVCSCTLSISSNPSWKYPWSFYWLVLVLFKILFLCGSFCKSLLNCLQYCFLFFFGHKASGILAPQPGSNPTLCIERGSFNHWITKEVPVLAPNREIINLITISHFYLNFIWYVGNLNFYIIKMLSLYVYAFFYSSSLF